MENRMSEPQIMKPEELPPPVAFKLAMTLLQQVQGEHPLFKAVFEASAEIVDLWMDKWREQQRGGMPPEPTEN